MTQHKKRGPSRQVGMRIGSVLALLAVLIVLQACDSATPTPAGTPTSTIVRAPGEATYIRYCNVCHPGGGLGAGPSLIGLKLEEDKLRGIIRHGKNRMPGFGKSTITDEELADLVHYVISLSR